MRQAAIVYNPRAGRGRPGELEARVGRMAEALGQCGWSVLEPMPTAEPRHAVELVAGLAEGVSRLIVLGGDGTLREAAEGLLGRSRDVSLGILPLGNGNVLARELRIPLADLDRALQVAASDRTVTMDVGRVNGRPFLAMVGVGFDALVTRWVDRIRQGPAGGWFYRRQPNLLYGCCGVVALQRLLLPTRFQVEIDGRGEGGRSGSVIVTNTRTYAKGWSLAPKASPFDGLLHSVLLRHAGPLATWPLLRAKACRPFGPFFGEVRPGRSIILRSDRPFLWQADGDPMGTADSLEIEVRPRALRIAVE